MNAVMPFEFGGEQIRSAMLDGKPALVLSDIAKVLGYRDAATAGRILRDHHKGYTEVRTPGGTQQMLVITEQGFNRLVIRSNAANAEQVQDFITDEVMPALSRTGSYAPVAALPDLSTPEGVLMLAQTLTQTAEKLVAAKAEVAVLAPLASQARTFNKAKGNTGRQKFTRGIVNWAIDNGYTVKFEQVYEFMGGRKLDLFVYGKGRSDHGHASTAGLRRGYSVTDRDESRLNGHPYEQGMLTPSGYEYAWARIETYVREHGHLELPKKGIAA